MTEPKEPVLDTFAYSESGLKLKICKLLAPEILRILPHVVFLVCVHEQTKAGYNNAATYTIMFAIFMMAVFKM